MTECPSRFTLVEWKTGDLAPEEMAHVGAHVEDCATCKRAASQIESNASEYRARADDHLRELKSRIDGLDSAEEDTPFVSILAYRQSRVKKTAIALGSLAAAAAIALVFIYQPPPSSDDTTPKNRFKGTMTFEVFAKRGEHQFKVKQGDRLRTNDALRFVITTNSAGYITVLSIDGAGRISPFYPDTAPTEDSTPMMVDLKGRNELPGSIVLDDVVGLETFVVVFSKTRFDRDEVHLRVKQVKQLERGMTLGDGNSKLYVGVLRVEKIP